MLEAKLFCNGEFVDTVSGSVIHDLNPADGSVVAEVHTAGPQEIDSALAAAEASLEAWGAMLAQERELLFYRASEHLMANQFRYASWLIDESGSAFMKAMDEVEQTARIFRSAGAQCRYLEGGLVPADQSDQISAYIRQPLGIIGGIAPFNYPLLLAAQKAAPAMAAGNAFILKPSGDTPLSALILAETVQAAGFPAGVFATAPGAGAVVGQTLIRDARVRMITFTGSTAVGREIARGCAEYGKKYTLEMGGKNPMIVLRDADVDYAVSAGAFGIFFHQGQICMATSRIIVEEPIYDEFCRKFATKAAAQKVGDPHDEGTIIGPLIHIEQVEKIDGLIADALARGAKLLTGGTHEGPWYAPTVLCDVTPDMRIFHEEVFGPVEVICKAADAEEALALCNNNRYGLSAALITDDLSKAMRLAPRMQAGMVHINDSTVVGARQAPFGGIKNSGMGREGGRFSMEEYTELKWVTVQTAKGGWPTDLYQ